VTQAKTADFLVELGTEELPPKALQKLRDAFRDGILQGLQEARLPCNSLHAYATPRRLAVVVYGLQSVQAAQEIEHRGPPVALAYDKAGKPSKAAEAFAIKCGVALDAITSIKTDKGEWLYYKGSVGGLPARNLLPAIVTNALNNLPVPKRMRWGSSPVEFVRPAHWLVMLLGDEVVDCEILGLNAGRTTYGHRFHSPGAIELRVTAQYAAAMRDSGRVIVDFAERRQIIETAAIEAARGINARAVLDPAVVDEVSALVEWPVAIVGSFEQRFLQLPPEVLISTLQDHQRYFPVENDEGLVPAFIAFSNLASKHPDEIRRGNERVVLPRLADAAFFWQQDIAVPLAQRQSQLQGVVYQKGLGTLQDKSQRVSQLAGLVGSYLSIDIDLLSRAAALARADLLTAMVGEFPD